MQTALLVSLQSIDVTLSLLIEMSSFFFVVVEMSVPSQKSDRSCIYALGVSILPFYDFGIGIFFSFFFHFITINFKFSSSTSFT